MIQCTVAKKKRLRRDLCNEARTDRHHQPARRESNISHKQSAVRYAVLTDAVV